MIQIRSQSDLEDWLRDKPRDWAVAIAVRAAMRVLPIALSGLPSNRHERSLGSSLNDFLLLFFRSVTTPWIAARYPDREVVVYISVPNLAVNVAIDFATRAASLAADAITAAVYASDETKSARYAGQAASYAADVVYYIGEVDELSAVSANWMAISADAERLSRVHFSTRLLDSPLWLAGETAASIEKPMRKAWTILSRRLRADDPNWKVWTDWYNHRLVGRRPKWDELELFRATLNSEEDWEHGSAHVNALIADKIKELKGEKVARPQPEPPEPPPPRAASIQPEIVEGKVAVPPRPAQVTFDPETFAAALGALEGLVAAVAQEAAEYPQVDRRAVAHLGAVAERLADARPTHRDFFAVGFEYDILKRYAETVKAEWPDLLAHKYEAAVDAIGRALSRFPAWVEFKKNLGETPKEISAEDLEEIVDLTRKAIEELRAPENSGIVDPSTPDAIEQVLQEIRKIDMEVGPDGARGAEEAAERVADLLEGIANTAKRFFQLCRERVTAVGGPIVKGAYEIGKKFAGGATGRIKEKAADFNDNADKYGAKFVDRSMDLLKKSFGPFVASAFMKIIFPDGDPLAFLAVFWAMNKKDVSEPSSEPDAEPKKKTPPKTTPKRSPSAKKPKSPPPKTEDASDDGDESDLEEGDGGEA